jgi:hypothetical protein
MTPPAASAAAAPAIAPRRTTSPRRAPATRRPRRISGPANPAHGRAGAIRDRSRARSGPAHAVGLAEAVATHRLLDRLIRGRVWIVVIAFALIGIVTMQLVLLKLNAGIGRSLVRETLLQRENATLSAENSEVAAGEQIEGQAEHEGMELIPAGALRFLTAHPSSDIGKAAATLSAPIAATSSTGGEATASDTSSTGEAAASSTASAGEATSSGSATAETTSAGSTGEAGAPAPAAAEAANTEAATTPAPAATSETQAAGASAASSAGASATPASGSSEAADTSAPTGQSAPISTGGGTPGG